MDFRFYNSSGCMSSSSNSSGGGSPDKKQQRPQRARAITGAHHFTNPQNVRRPLYQSEGKFLEEPQPPQAGPQQSLFWDVTLPKMQPIVDLVITAYFFPTYLGGFIAFYSIFALLYTFVFMNIEFRSLRRPHKKIGATFHLDMMLLSNV